MKRSVYKNPLYKGKEYYIWVTMRQRCYNPKNKKYPRYGARGIHVCEGMNTFHGFIGTVGVRDNASLSLDRINNDKGYLCGHCIECIENCWDRNVRWATATEQANNRRPHKNKTGFPGVTTTGKRFKAQIWIDGEYIELGKFNTPEQAHEVFIKAQSERDSKRFK